jgi:chromosomal replication initiation ATPase DnaA
LAVEKGGLAVNFNKQITWPQTDAQIRQSASRSPALQMQEGFAELRSILQLLKNEVMQMAVNQEYLSKAVIEMTGTYKLMRETRIHLRTVVNGKRTNTRNVILHIIRALCDLTRAVTLTQVLGRSRQSHVVIVRHVCMHVAAEVMGFNTVVIGRAMHRDHSTVLHGLKLVATSPDRYQPLLHEALSLFSQNDQAVVLGVDEIPAQGVPFQ